MILIEKCPKSCHDKARLFIINILIKEFGLKDIPRPDIEDISGTYQKDSGEFWIALK